MHFEHRTDKSSLKFEVARFNRADAVTINWIYQFGRQAIIGMMTCHERAGRGRQAGRVRYPVPQDNPSEMGNSEIPLPLSLSEHRVPLQGKRCVNLFLIFCNCIIGLKVSHSTRSRGGKITECEVMGRSAELARSMDGSSLSRCGVLWDQ